MTGMHPRGLEPELFWVDDGNAISRVHSMLELQRLGGREPRVEITTFGAVGPLGPKPLTPSLWRLLHHATALMRAGWVVEVTQRNNMMTTQQAADVLEISRPTLIRLLEKGEIPYQRVGTHRRLFLVDVHAFAERSRTRPASRDLWLRGATEDPGATEHPSDEHP